MKLPIGVYAVSQTFAQQEKCVEFAFKGVSYEAQLGVNAFATLEDFTRAELLAAQEDFCGYCGMPILLMPEGVYKNGESAVRAERLRTHFPCPLTILGENAGVSPNGDDLRTAVWGGGSVIQGSFYFGSLGVKDPQDGLLTLDGLTLRTTRVADDRTQGENVGLELKNCVFDGFCVYSLVRAKPMAGGAGRFVRLKNVRADGIDDRAAEGRLLEIASGDLFVDGLYVAGTEKFLGLTDYSRRDRSDLGKVELRNVLVEESACTRGLSIMLPERSRARILMENCQLLNAVPEEDPAFSICLPETAQLTLRHVRFEGRSRQPAVLVDGKLDGVTLENVSQQGYAALVTERTARRTEAADQVACLDDPHAPVEGDFGALDALYAGAKAYYGDYHCHSNSGGTSDGKTPIEEYAAGMERMGVDFAAIVDHRQMRHFFLPCWDETKMVCGTEPGTRLVGTDRPEQAQLFDYTMIFPDKTGLRKVLEHFPFYEFGGNWDDSFRASDLTPQQVAEVCEYVYSVGGMFAHAHPRQYMDSDEPMDYWFSEHMGLETVHGDNYAFSTAQNRALWVKLLNLGKRVRTYGSSDSHAGVSNRGLTAVFSRERHSKAFFEQVRSGNCTAGGVAIQMSINDAPMGAVTDYAEGKKLYVRVADIHPAHKLDATVYSLRVYTEQGLAYYREFTEELPAVILPVQRRSYYRAEVWNESDGGILALTNPIWLE